MSRLHRKNDHLYEALRKMPGRADFSEISFVHNCLPDCDLQSISLETSYLGRTYRSPLFINAMTGGTDLALRVNTSLSLAAKNLAIPMALGSQMVALESKSLKAVRSFRIARMLNPGGSLWANVGSYADTLLALRAIKMIDADALQIHLNAAQELAMPEGEDKFSGMITRIRDIANSSTVPVIVKEVGSGIAKKEARLIAECGVKGIDVGGSGGTNFIDIEGGRSGQALHPEFKEWGISTANSLLEVIEAVGESDIDIFASGGMHNPFDIAKALAIGARAVGMAGMPLYILMNYGRQALCNWIRNIEDQLKLIMMMTGSTDLVQFRDTPLVITGYTAEWMCRRGLDPDRYARRGNDE